MAGAAPNPRHLRARIRKLGGARPSMAPTGSELMWAAERIHSSVVSFISLPNTRHSDILNDLPRDYQSIPWKCVYDAGEAYKPTGLIDEPWSPRCLDYSRKSWCFTVLPLLSRRSVVRLAVDKTSNWYSDRGRPKTTSKHYPNDLLVNRLRTKKPIEGMFFRMIEITIADQTPAIVALCRIREDPDAVTKLLEQQQAHGNVILEATDVEIGQPQQVNLAFQHGLLDTEANMNPIMVTASNISREIQPRLITGASMNQMTAASDINEGTYSAQAITIDGAMEYYNGHENYFLSEDVACHLGPDVDDYMDHSAIFSNPHEGIINSTTGHDLTSNFLEDVSTILANKDLYTLIDFIDENSSAALANHVKQAALILKNFAATAVNPSQGVTGDFDVMEFLRDDPA